MDRADLSARIRGPTGTLRLAQGWYGTGPSALRAGLPVRSLRVCTGSQRGGSPVIVLLMLLL